RTRAGGQGDVRDVAGHRASGGVEERHWLLVHLDVDIDPVATNRIADRRRSEGLPDALDPDCRHALRLAQGQGVWLVIVHPADLHEEVLVVRGGALCRERRAVAVDVDLRAQREVLRAVAVEVNASRTRAAT